MKAARRNSTATSTTRAWSRARTRESSPRSSRTGCPMNAEGLNKAALLLMSIGEEEAAEVFKYLAPREVQKIGATMAALKNVTREQLDNVLTEFVHEAEQHTALSLDSSELHPLGADEGARRDQGRRADRPHPAGQRHERHRRPEVDGRGRGRGADQERASADHRDDPRSPRPRPGIGNRRAAHRPAAQRRAAAHRDARRHPAGGAARTRRRADHAPLRQRQPEARADGRHPHGGGNPQLHVEQPRRIGARERARNTTRNSRRRSSTRCSCSKTCSISKTARSSCC